MGNIYKNKIQSLGLAVFSFSIVYKMDYKCILCHHRQRAHKFSKLLWPSLSALRGKGLKVAFSFQKFPQPKWHSVAGNVLFAIYRLRRRVLEKGSDSNFIFK